MVHLTLWVVIFLDRCVTGSKIVNFTEKLLIMADNYLEKRYDEYVARKEAEQKARQRAWKKRLDAYRRKLAEEHTVMNKHDNSNE